MITYLQRLEQFHEAPVVKFFYNAISYIFFLLVFSYYLLFNFNPPVEEGLRIHWTEIFVILNVSSMLTEDARQVKNISFHWSTDQQFFFRMKHFAFVVFLPRQSDNIRKVEELLRL